MPADAIAADPTLINTIYEDLTVQLAYEVGTPERTAIISAYGEAQKIMCIAGTAFMALSLIWVLVIRNIRVDKTKQVKGTVF